MSGTSSSFLTKSIILIVLVIIAFGGSTYAGKELGRKIMDVTRSNLNSHNMTVDAPNQSDSGDNLFIDLADGRSSFGFDSDGFGSNQFPREWADPGEQDISTVNGEANVVINLLDPTETGEPAADGTTGDETSGSETPGGKPDGHENPFDLGSGTGAEAGDATYRIQVGTFSDSANAESVWSSLIQAGYDASISTYTEADKVMYRVQVGMYHDRAEADQDAEELRSMNFDAWVYELN
ncbi:MAG: SPOR domain-containing protein [bacterium]|nr:SPOR domain-containing protein [bacterium]